MHLTRGDLTTEVWKRFRQDLEERLEALRASNDPMHLTEAQTIAIRGKIAMVKEWLALSADDQHESADDLMAGIN